MAVFKDIGGGNHKVESFEVNASHSFAWTSGSTFLSGSGFSINLANEPPIYYPIGTQDLGGTTDGGFSSYPMFNSVKKYFYVAEEGLAFSGKYNDLDLNADNGEGKYSFNTVGGTDVSAGTNTNAGIKAAVSLLIHQQSVIPSKDRSTSYDAVEVGDIVIYKISHRRWYKYKITSVDTSPTGYDNRYRFGIELIDSDTYDGTDNVSYTAGAVEATFKFTGPGGDVYGFYPSGSMFVWNVGSNYTGEGIKRNSFKVELDGNSLNVQDDGTGKLRLNATGSVVGNVFYEHGVAAIQRNMTASAASLISDDGISILDTAGVTSSFQSVVHIYEHIVDCQIKPSEFNLTFNPSVFETASSGIGSFNDYMNSGSAQPYITTIGLYNDAKELLVVAKLSKPITRMKYTDQTFIVKFDE